MQAVYKKYEKVYREKLPLSHKRLIFISFSSISLPRNLTIRPTSTKSDIFTRKHDNNYWKMCQRDYTVTWVSTTQYS